MPYAPAKSLSFKAQLGKEVGRGVPEESLPNCHSFVDDWLRNGLTKDNVDLQLWMTQTFAHQVSF